MNVLENRGGGQIYRLAEKLFPICRSITGDGVRKTLAILAEYIEEYETEYKLKTYQVPSGTKVFDWVVPKEWRIREAWIEYETGERIIDFKDHNLHVVGYSTPIDKWVSLEELKDHVWTEPGQPDVIPYVTSYYKENYGFCMSETQKKSLQPGRYHMYIDSELFDGSLTYGEMILPGESKEEIFVSTYICHPSMANNECSGPALSAELIRFVSSMKNRKYTYRFIFIPETIGAITYLSKNLDYMKEHVIAGFNLSCVGDERDYSMVESRYADTLADKVLQNVLEHCNQYTRYSFLKRGSDERQYNAPGVELPVVCFCRSKFSEYPEYHTSADNMDFITPDGLQGSYEVMTQVLTALEYNSHYKTTVLCEPQLGKRGLYSNVSKKGINGKEVDALLDFMAYADGRNDLIEISDRIGVSVKDLIPIIEILKEINLIEDIETRGISCNENNNKGKENKNGSV